MRFNEAIKELQNKKHRRFILTGEEAYLKDSFIRAAIGSNEAFSYYPGEESEAQDTLYSSSLFEEDQIVILYYYDNMKTKGFKDVIKKYKGYVFVVLSSEANLKTAALIEIAGMCVHVSCSKMSEYNNDYPSWLVTKAAEKSFIFMDDAETLLYKRVGPDMFMLNSELEKIMLYKDQSKSIMPDDIGKVVSFSVLASNFDILDFLLKKDIPKALKVLQDYQRNNDDMEGFIFFLGNYFEKLYRMLLLNADKISAESIASIVNLSPTLVKNKYLPRALAFGLPRLADILGQLVALEVNLRTSSIKESLITKFIFSFN